MKSSVSELKTLLNANGLKATTQRLAIFGIIKDTDIHPSADYIMRELEKKGLSMPFATIYNVLEALSSHGLIKKIYFNSEIMRFDANTNFHIHISKENGTRIRDYFDSEICQHIHDYIKDNIKDAGQISNIEILINVE